MTEQCEKRVLGAPDAQVMQTKDVKMTKPLLVCCFPSAGVVGTIAANVMIEQFKMEEIAHVRSKHIPSAAVFLDGRLRHPFRIYSSVEKKLILVTTELPISDEGLYFISSALLDWAASVGVEEAVVLDGIPVQGLPAQRKVLYAAEEEKIKDLEQYEEMEILKKGIISGIAGSILSETLCREMVGFALLTPAMAMVPDPDGAIQLLDALKKLYSVEVDVDELEESGDKIRQKMEEMAKEVDSMRKTGRAAPRAGYERIYA